MMLFVFAISAGACACLLLSIVAAVALANASRGSARREVALAIVELPEPGLEVYGV